MDKGCKLFSLLVSLLAVLTFIHSARGESPSCKVFTIENGLAHDCVNRIVRDSRGFLWLCTAEGLSRFDGYGFVNYGVTNGLPHANVKTFLETLEGDYLFGTQDGLAQFDPLNSSFVRIYTGERESEKSITALAEDQGGVVWIGTPHGLYRLIKNEGSWRSEFIEFERKTDKELAFYGLNSILVDKKNSLWIGTSESGVFHRLADGHFEHYTELDGLPQNGISDIFQDREDKIWVGTGMGLTLLVDDPKPGRNVVARIFTTKDGLFRDHIATIFQSSDGRLWVGDRGGLNYLVNKSDEQGYAFRGYSEENNLPRVRIQTITEDGDSNLWVGGEIGGARKLPLKGFISYFEKDGLETARVEQVFTDSQNNPYILSVHSNTSLPLIGRFDGRKFADDTPPFPSDTGLSWGTNQLVMRDREGDWWIGALNGLFRFAGEGSDNGLRHLRLKKHFTKKDGLDENNIFRVFEDVQGDIWFSTIGENTKKSLHRWDRKTDKIVAYDLPSLGIPLAAATAFANDSDGNLWIGFYNRGVARVHDGHFSFYTEKDGVPNGSIRHLFVDNQKRLWIATSQNGVTRVDHPSATTLEFIHYTTNEGLSSNEVTTVTEDKFGRIYFGTGRGIDRLEPDSNRTKHFTTADGLADDSVNTSLADANGVLWFGTLHGLSRLVPEPDKPQTVPAVFISGLRVGGVKQTISGFGQTEVSIANLATDQNQLEMDFLSISNASGDYLRYQYKFDGDADWSAPSLQRTVTLANLPPASYRFFVRAINSDNVPSEVPAIVSFRILPPVWRRGWFIALGLLVVGGAITSMYKFRVSNLRRVNSALSEAKLAEERLRKSREERLADLERVRSRIATDLHDDIGASLTQIAILSEVARQKKPAHDNNGNSEQLSAIYDLSNELVSTMSDIVWAINPQKDKLHDLTLRMRRFASDVLSARDIELEFEAPEEIDDFPLDSNLRREVFLIFKESVNNIVKHANAAEVEIELTINKRNLFLTVKDNGKGFKLQPRKETPSANLFANYKGGNGLANLKRRATEMGGEFEISSEIGKGTTINLRLPITIQSGGDAATLAE